MNVWIDLANSPHVLFFAPIVEYLGRFPESAAMLESRPNIRRAHTAMRARPSYAATQPNFG